MQSNCRIVSVYKWNDIVAIDAKTNDKIAGTKSVPVSNHILPSARDLWEDIALSLFRSCPWYVREPKRFRAQASGHLQMIQTVANQLFLLMSAPAVWGVCLLRDLWSGELNLARWFIAVTTTALAWDSELAIPTPQLLLELSWTWHAPKAKSCFWHCLQKSVLFLSLPR